MAAALPSALSKHLEKVVGWAVNPTDKSVQWDKVSELCADIKKDKNIVHIQKVVDVLMIKLHSQSFTISLSALTVLESCVKSCGPPIHSIVGKNKFLNELIKIANPKFNSPSPQELKQRILAAMQQWAHSIPQRPKIREAITMLVSQGVAMPTLPQPQILVIAGPGYIDTPAPRAPPSTGSAASKASASSPPLLEFDSSPASPMTSSTSNPLWDSGLAPAPAQATPIDDPFNLGLSKAISSKAGRSHYEDDVSSQYSLNITPGKPSIANALADVAGSMAKQIRSRMSTLVDLGEPISSGPADPLCGSPTWHEGYIMIGKRETENLLMGYPAGSYLIRESSSAIGTFALAVRDENSVEHFRIVTERGQLHIAGSDHKFKRLDDLVAFYRGPGADHMLPVRLNDGIYGMYRAPAHEAPTGEEDTPASKSNQDTGATIVKREVAKDDVWELERKDLLLGETLGVGHFGKVCLAKLRVPWGGEIEVAVKMTKANRMTSDAFLAEAGKLKQLQHRNIVKVYGLCTSEDPIFIVFEYTSGGSLFDFLKSRKGGKLTLHAQTVMMKDIAAGMAFLEESHWVHADLATRNCLVGDQNVVKLCDFGHAIQTDEENSPIKNAITIPIRWSAPEFFDTIMCCPATDVWSFGVVVVEILLRGAIPYPEMDMPGIGYDNKTLVAMLINGFRMKQAKKVPCYFYDLMLDCWQANPANRPTFAKLLEILTLLTKTNKLKEFGEYIVDGNGKSNQYLYTGPKYNPLTQNEVRADAAKTLLEWQDAATNMRNLRGRELSKSIRSKGKRTIKSSLAAIYDEPDWTRKVGVNGGAPGEAVKKAEQLAAAV